MLFIVHREQIAIQAMESFRLVLGETGTYGLLSGHSKDYGKTYLFATMNMMAKDDIMKQFTPDEFDLIIIDETHRAGADSYQKIMSYFTPGFWLGMTASPERMDDFDIFKLFDHNIACEIRLQQALEEDLLCPFHYFGITEFISDANGEVDENDLRSFSRLVADERVDFILQQAEYYGHSGNRVKGLVFCSRNKEARELSEKFNARGYHTVALDGADAPEKRLHCVDLLTGDDQGDYLDYIFTVDIFNEGVDLPEINQVIMLRPTQSAIVFIQQLGRGLRKKEDKEFVVILDFIGNYSNNFLIPIALSGDRTYNKDNMRKYLMEGSSVIPGCSTIHFDEISRKTIFSAIDKSTTPLKFLKEKYFNLRDRLGRMPTADEFYRHGEIDPILFIDYKKGSYYRFVRAIDKDCGLEEFSEKQNQTLDFICTQIVNGKRPHELLMLQELLEEGSVDPERTRSRLQAYDAALRDEDYRSALGILDKTFLNTQADKGKYALVSFFEDSGELQSQQVRRCAEYLKRLSRMSRSEMQFRDAAADLIHFGLARYSDNYSDTDEDNLVLYQKYSRRDVCRILNWEKDDSSTIYGYRIKYGTCPIFVTYEKKDDISETTKYEDQFVDPQVFSWMTRSRVSLDSTESQEIIHHERNGLKIYLFIKKSDGEGTDFYYMGRVRPIAWQETTIADKNGRLLPIMNFRMRLAHTVRNDIYDYLTK